VLFLLSRTWYKMLSQSLVFTYGWDWITFQQGNKCCKYSSILFVQRIAYRLLFLDCSQDLLLYMVKQFSARDQAYSNIWLCLQAISQVEEISWQPLVVATSLVVSRLLLMGVWWDSDLLLLCFMRYLLLFSAKLWGRI
jgi:hypothetical protein